jgi:ADP-heptose:LPS heptosyltransferase
LKKKNIFILRNNDMGDVLVSTSLVHGLKRAFPNSKISMGVGDWAKPLLQNNPDLDQIASCNAPWHNKQNCNFPANSPRTYLHGLFYVLLSKEARYLRNQKFSHGIDVLGSRQGSWLLRRAGISNCYGVKGYAGGDSWCHQNITFDPNIHVAKAGLNFLTLFNEKCNVEARPKIYLTREEVDDGLTNWQTLRESSFKIVIAPGGGFREKCWGDDNFNNLTELLLKETSSVISIIGSNEDRPRIRLQESEQLKNWCGSLSLRESAAMVSQSDFVISNSSLPMHLAGAFKIPSITLLGECYKSAKLHHNQWGYPEGIVLGKETSDGINCSTSVDETYVRVNCLLARSNFKKS